MHHVHDTHASILYLLASIIRAPLTATTARGAVDVHCRRADSKAVDLIK
jgi:hypothetical protein